MSDSHGHDVCDGGQLITEAAGLGYLRSVPTSLGLSNTHYRGPIDGSTAGCTMRSIGLSSQGPAAHPVYGGHTHVK